MISLSQYIKNTNNQLKLSDADKNKLLLLDKRYGDLCEKFGMNGIEPIVKIQMRNLKNL